MGTLGQLPKQKPDIVGEIDEIRVRLYTRVNSAVDGKLWLYWQEGKQEAREVAQWVQSSLGKHEDQVRVFRINITVQ